MRDMVNLFIYLFQLNGIVRLFVEQNNSNFFFVFYFIFNSHFFLETFNFDVVHFLSLLYIILHFPLSSN